MDDQQLWAQFAAAAIVDNGTTTDQAAKIADAMLAEFRKRFPMEAPANREESYRRIAGECIREAKSGYHAGSRKLVAIKLLRERLRIGLAQAKQMIEEHPEGMFSARTGADR